MAIESIERKSERRKTILSSSLSLVAALHRRRTILLREVVSDQGSSRELKERAKEGEQVGERRRAKERERAVSDERRLVVERRESD